MQKNQKKKKNHLIFINFGKKKFTLKNIQKKKTLKFACYNVRMFERLIFLTMSKTAKFGPKNTRNLRD
jgi:hypothetical protein